MIILRSAKIISRRKAWGVRKRRVQARHHAFQRAQAAARTAEQPCCRCVGTVTRIRITLPQCPSADAGLNKTLAKGGGKGVLLNRFVESLGLRLRQKAAHHVALVAGKRPHLVVVGFGARHQTAIFQIGSGLVVLHAKGRSQRG